MSSSDDLPPPRRPLLVPVVLATVLLCLIGVGAGLALGARHKADVRAGGRTPAPQPADTWTPPVSPPPRPSGKACLEQTQATARAHGVTAGLTQALLLQTRTSTVYICEDGDGNYYYHANNTRSGGDWVEGRSAIFLTGVVKKGSTYEATADDGVVFSVSSTRLLIRHKDGSTEVQYASG